MLLARATPRGVAATTRWRVPSVAQTTTPSLAASATVWLVSRTFSSSSSSSRSPTIKVNDRTYAVPMTRPVVAILLDGSSQEYIDAACEAHRMPNYMAILGRRSEQSEQQNGGDGSIARPSFATRSSPSSSPTLAATGCTGLVSTIMPTFTNPNNVAVICGAPSKVTGICGNYFYDTTLKTEVSMNDPSHLRCDTILAALNRAGSHVTVITAKDKLKRLLAHGLDPHRSRAFSVEQLGAAAATTSRTRLRDELALPDLPDTVPSIYDPMCSIFALQLGYELLRQEMRAQQVHSPQPVYYISTTDYVQHHHAPGAPAANDFYAHIDRWLGAFHGLSSASSSTTTAATSTTATTSTTAPVIGFTADHGMNEKTSFDGRPKIVFLSTVLAQAGIAARVILPITDAHVCHHGALGSYATVHIESGDAAAADHAAEVRRAMDVLRAQPGIYTVLGRDDAARSLDLPADRIGDMVVIATRDGVVGKDEAWHHDSLVELAREHAESGRVLRSHGGLDEMVVPMFVNQPVRETRKLRALRQGKLRNYDLFDVLLNAV